MSNTNRANNAKSPALSLDAWAVLISLAAVALSAWALSTAPLVAPASTGKRPLAFVGARLARPLLGSLRAVIPTEGLTPFVGPEWRDRGKA